MHADHFRAVIGKNCHGRSERENVGDNNAVNLIGNIDRVAVIVNDLTGHQRGAERCAQHHCQQFGREIHRNIGVQSSVFRERRTRRSPVLIRLKKFFSFREESVFFALMADDNLTPLNVFTSK
ncbi:hypothetical protein EVA_11868 [gut metagenome]|uniref:Uncharacterized protein n=1 Tax=gut metagenome TaxID=749906 RepID=J9CJ01_9ZZZZ